MTCHLVVVPGVPVAFARPRPHFTKPGVYIHPKKYRIWLAEAKRWISMNVHDEPLDVPVSCEVVAIFPRPKSWPKKMGTALRWKDTIPDLDNIQKAALDAGNGLLYTDDRLVVRLSGTKLYGQGCECGLAIHVAPAPMISLPWGLNYRACDCWSRARFMDRGEGAEPHPTKRS